MRTRGATVRPLKTRGDSTQPAFCYSFRMKEMKVSRPTGEKSPGGHLCNKLIQNINRVLLEVGLIRTYGENLRLRLENWLRLGANPKEEINGLEGAWRKTGRISGILFLEEGTIH